MAGKTATAEVPEVVGRTLGEGSFSVEKFVGSFPVLVEAAGAVDKLRHLVRTMAFTGRLVRQSKADSSVELTLDEVQKAWSRRHRKEVLPSVSESEVPALPDRWSWIRLGNLAELIGGVTKGRDLKGRKRISLPYLRVANVQRGFLDLGEIKEIEIAKEELAKYRLEPGDVLFTEGGDWDKLGRSAIWQGQIKNCIHQNHVFRARFVSPQLDPAWFSAFANSPVGRSYFENAAKRTTNLASINMTQLRNCPMPLPPLAEQKRIVARVDQLMALIDQLEAKQNQKRDLGARFTKASLEALTTAEIPEFSLITEWPRIAENWSTILDHPDKVDELRHAVLELAIRGRLVPNDPSDKPVKVPECRILDGIPIPSNWQRTTIANTFEVVGGIQKTPARTPKHRHHPYLRVENVQRGRLNLERIERFELQAGELERWRLRAGDLLVVEGNGSPTEIGRCAIWNGEINDCVHQNHIIRCRPTSSAWSPYVLLFLNSPSGMAEMRELAITTSGLYSLSVGKVRGINLPLPPLAEQKRIVAKVEHLMKLCDALEAALRRREDRAAKLAEAVVQEMVA